MTKLYQMEDLKWLEKHAFKDQDGDYWRTEKARDHYVTVVGDLTFEDELIYGNQVGGILRSENTISSEGNCVWAIKEVYTNESHPEMFL